MMQAIIALQNSALCLVHDSFSESRNNFCRFVYRQCFFHV
jgi:hypothetical protein